MTARLDRRSATAILVTVALWASAFPAIRAGLKAYEPGQLVLLRFMVASLVLGGYALLRRMRLPARRDVLGMVATGLAGFTCYQLLLSYGERTVASGPASMLVNLSPIITVLLATAFLGERLRGRGWAGIVVSLAGAALISVGEGGAVRLEAGIGLILLAALSQGAYFILQKRRLARYSPLELTTYAVVAGTVFLLAFAPGLLTHVHEAPPGATLAIVYLGVLPAALANVSWAYALARIPASRAASFLYLVPGIATLIGWLWLAELPSGLACIGGGIALLGVAIVNTR